MQPRTTPRVIVGEASPHADEGFAFQCNVIVMFLSHDGHGAEQLATDKKSKREVRASALPCPRGRPPDLRDQTHPAPLVPRGLPVCWSRPRVSESDGHVPLAPQPPGVPGLIWVSVL